MNLQTIKPIRTFFFLSTTLTLLTSCNPIQQLQQLTANPGQAFAPSIRPIYEMVLSTSDSIGFSTNGDPFSSAPDRSNWELRIDSKYQTEVKAAVRLEANDLFFALNPNTPRSILEQGLTLQFKSPNLRVGLWEETSGTYFFQDNPVWQTEITTLPAILNLQIRPQNPNQFVPIGGMVEMFVCPIKEKMGCYTVAMELAQKYNR